MKPIKHKHLITRCYIKKPPGKNDVEYIKQWLTKLIADIGMNLLVGPIATYLDANGGNGGITGAAIIETSHIAFHVWDEESPALLQLDVYSCADFEKSVVYDALKEFEPTNIRFILLDREQILEIVEEGQVVLDVFGTNP
jgi:S-adenosylmethionine/arginine decarboxylase-like enzyme